MKSVQHLILGVQFLTRIPITKKAVPCEPSDFKGAMAFFTFIGLMIGGIQYITYTLSAALLTTEMAVLLTCMMGIWLTGGLHLDGLADLADAWGANAPKERSLEIMKDSRVGTFGVIAIVLDFAVHFIGFYSLREVSYLYLLVPVGAKMAVCGLAFVGESIKKGMGSLWIDVISQKELVINGTIVCVLGSLSIGVLETVIGMVLIAGGAQLFNRSCKRRLGGINGDCLGAISQLAEWGVILYLMIGVKF